MEYAVTIGIPVYNVEKFIRLTMDSALAQSFQSIEFLILDDCGTDKSVDIVREYQQPRNGSLSNFQKCHYIAKKEIMETIQAISQNKNHSDSRTFYNDKLC